MTATSRLSTKSAADMEARGCKRATALSILMLTAVAASHCAAILQARLGADGKIQFVLLGASAGACLLLAIYLGLQYRHHRKQLIERARTRQEEAGLFDVDTETFGPKYVELAYNHEMAQSYRSHAPLTLMSASFDYERVAKIHGPAAAEHLVQVLAQILKSSLRGSDIICHYNLGEFVVLFPDTDVRQADIPRRRVVRATEHWNKHTRVKYRLSANVGLGDCWEGLAVALRDARMVRSMAPAPPFAEASYVPRPRPVAVN